MTTIISFDRGANPRCDGGTYWGWTHLDGRASLVSVWSNCVKLRPIWPLQLDCSSISANLSFILMSLGLRE